MLKKCVLLVNKPNQPIIKPIIRDNIKSYADKINADFIEIESFFGTFYLYHILKDYKRAICFNGNIIIRDDAPDLFDIVPDNKLGLLNEGFFLNPSLKFMEARRNYPDMIINKWNHKYYNTNVVVASRKDRNFFKSPHFKEEQGLPNEDQLLNLRIVTEKKKVFELVSKYNRAHYMDNIIARDRLDSYIINYEGAPFEQLYRTILDDLRRLDECNGDYSKFNKRNIGIVVSGGMGDQICSEPIIRYVANKEFKNDNIKVVTHHPRFFRHIENVDVIDYNEDNRRSTPSHTLTLYTNPDGEHNMANLSHVYFHPTDFSSISLIKKTIPNEDKTIKIETSLEGVSEIIDIIGNDIDILKNMILIHPGKWWASKTFPKWWWQEIVDKISEKGITVGLIGKTLSKKQGFVDIDCPENGIDFRDLTTLDGMITLIDSCPVLLTNDSSPIHIGGAFDNWIVTLATAKLDDHILPYRNGTQHYKTINLAIDLLLDDLDSQWFSESPDMIAKIPDGKKIEDYLPNTDEAVNILTKVFENKLDNYWRQTHQNFDIYDVIDKIK